MRFTVTALVLLFTAGPGLAQDCPPCPPPPPAWTVSVGAGLALTGGNSDTSSYNIAANATYDPRKKNVFRGELLYLRAAEGGEATLDRMLAALRDEYAVTGRLFARAAFADDYKTRPARPELDKNDTSFIVTLLFKP